MNVAHALALGIDEKEIYVQSQKDPRYYEFAFEISKRITENEFRAVYGGVDLGKVSANILQYADILHQQLPEYQGKMPSITGIAPDQDPHARVTRDVASRLPYDLEMPSFIYFMHQSGLQEGKKMSSSEPDTAIFLDDTPAEVKRKIGKAFTGGRDTVEEQKQKGGRPEVCKIYEMYKFHHPDSKFVQDVCERCKKGQLFCGEDKKMAIEFLNSFLAEHQKKVEKSIPKAKKIVYGDKK
jgi:tryptophanyl-tRNA synthetase